MASGIDYWNQLQPTRENTLNQESTFTPFQQPQKAMLRQQAMMQLANLENRQQMPDYSQQETPQFSLEDLKNFTPDQFQKVLGEYATQNDVQPMIAGAGVLKGVKLTQPFGNRSSIEKYSGGVNLGADFATPMNTPLPIPDGNWQVIEASSGFNNGSGNIVKVRNTKTGEVLGFEHLNKISVKPGQTISGGTVIGLSGGGQSGPGRGNSSGSHASLIYLDPSGKYGDILTSPYARYYFG